jgi:hypothetical protein
MVSMVRRTMCLISEKISWNAGKYSGMKRTAMNEVTDIVAIIVYVSVQPLVGR